MLIGTYVLFGGVFVPVFILFLNWIFFSCGVYRIPYIFLIKMFVRYVIFKLFPKLVAYVFISLTESFAEKIHFDEI